MMNGEDHIRGYARHLYDQLGTAVAHGDADAAMRIIDQADADGHEQAAKIAEEVLTRTTLGPALAEPVPDDPTDPRS